MSDPMFEPVAMQALLAKLSDLADERGIARMEVAEKDELLAAAFQLLTREDDKKLQAVTIDFMVKEAADKEIAERVASGEWTFEDGIIRRVTS